MIATIAYNSRTYQLDLSKPLDISMPLSDSKNNVNAWYLEQPEIKPVKIGDWVGAVKKGAAVNFNTVTFNPHAHGTHTECVGHITKEFHSINQSLKHFFFLAQLISITPDSIENDLVITKSQIQRALLNKPCEALIIRTLPNSDKKRSRQYSNTNPAYLLEEAAIYLKEIGITHLLIDLPSVDKEKDDGKLLAHHAFWDTQGTMRTHATITEFIYVDNNIKDGTYFLNLQIAAFENDAAPSKPVLYKTM